MSLNPTNITTGNPSDNQRTNLSKKLIDEILKPLEAATALDEGSRWQKSIPYRFKIIEMAKTLDSLPPAEKRALPAARARAHLARLAGDLETAEVILRETLQDVPHQTDLLHDLILSLKDQERIQEAEELCFKAINKHPLSVTLQLDLAAVLAERAHLDKAIVATKKATELRPESAVSWFTMGNLQLLSRRFSMAGEAYSNCADLAPTDPSGPFMLGRSLSSEYRDKEAVEAYQEAYRRVMKDEGHWSAIACHLRKRFTGDTAIRDCAAFFDQHYHQNERPIEFVLGALTGSLLKAGNLDSAVETATELTSRANLTAISAPQKTPKDDQSYYLLGVALFLQRKYKQAVPPLRRAATLKNKDVRLSFLLASCLWYLGDHEGAIQACMQSMVWFASGVPRPGFINRAHTGEQANTRVTLPWNMRMYQTSGMFHPLINEVTQEVYEDFSLEYPVAHQKMQELQDSCIRVLEHFAATRDWLEEKCPDVSPGHLFNFLETRHFLSQTLADNPSHDFTILHTAPYVLNETPWLLHLEVPITAFFPFISYGISWDLDFENKPYYKLAKAYIESKQCLGIFSHLKSTCEALPRLFHNPLLAEKIHYFPLSAPTLESSQASKPSTEGAPIKILFTGSFNHDSWSFYSRGGLYVVEAL
ncbi:MAG: hypothetical protein L3J63_02640, partial [Geopsychrobacter sp.]|nr:hypothetical protein [Geopsychrobacter sp.]